MTKTDDTKSTPAPKKAKRVVAAAKKTARNPATGRFQHAKRARSPKVMHYGAVAPAGVARPASPAEKAQVRITEVLKKTRFFRNAALRADLDQLNDAQILDLVAETARKVKSRAERAKDQSVAAVRARALIAGRKRFDELIERRGGAVSTGEAADILGVQPNTVCKQVQRRQLVAYKGPDGYRLPAAQFQGHSAIKNLRKVLAAFPEGVSDKDVTLFFLSSLDGGKPPIERLHSGESVPLLVERAKHYQQQGLV